MANCPHGFPAGECLICQTLGTGPSRGPVQAANGDSAGSSRSKRRRAKVQDAPTASSGVGTALATRSAGLAPGPTSTVQLTDRSTAPERRRIFPALLAAVVGGGVLVWLFGGLFSLAFHIVEYVAIAAGSGWVGFRLGHARGRHDRR